MMDLLRKINSCHVESRCFFFLTASFSISQGVSSVQSFSSVTFMRLYQGMRALVWFSLT